MIKFIINNIPRPLLIRLSYIFRIFTPILYRGNNVECPVCEKSFRKFLPYGYVIQRESVLCPYDLTLERHRLMWLYLKNESSFFKAEKLNVLHIAPEQCFYKIFKNQKKHFNNLDESHLISSDKKMKKNKKTYFLNFYFCIF